MRLPIAEYGILRRQRHPEKIWKPTLSGTWDFKWLLDSVIRVAIQELPECEGVASRIPEHAIAKLNWAFQEWGVPEVAKGGNVPAPGRPRLSFEILSGRWPAPERGHALSPVTPSSVELLPSYDILVSFAPLPLILPATEYYEQEDLIMTPQSELGTYSRRLDLGLPSMYLGPEKSQWRSWDEWLDSPHATFVFLHEVGHALGLAHEHQNPKRTLLWNSDLNASGSGEHPSDANWSTATRKVMDNHLPPPGLCSNAILAEKVEYLKVEKSPWPGGPYPGQQDERCYSDWRNPGEGPINGKTLIESVMVTPYYRCLLRFGKCTDGREHQEHLYWEHAHVSDEDRKQLCQMYQYPKGKGSDTRDSDKP